MNIKTEDQHIIPHSKPTLGQTEIDLVSSVLESTQIAQGGMVRKFEKEFAEKIGVKYAAAVNSGTSALHLSLLALGIGPGDEVIIPSYVCTALINAINYTGAQPVLADIDFKTYNISPGDVKRRVTKQTRAVIVPHLFGQTADLNSFLDLDIPIIEDCAQAVGSTYHEKPVGAFGTISVFSFYATKVMTTGEGGLVVCDDEQIIDHIKNLREYDNMDSYEIRYNYKMTDINAAVGLAQLSHLEEFIEKRKIIAEKYINAFRKTGFCPPENNPEHIYYRFVMNLSTDASPYIEHMKKKGILCARPVHIPIHQYLGMKGYPNTDQAWKESISIPIYPSLSYSDINRIINDFLKTCKEIKGER